MALEDSFYQVVATIARNVTQVVHKTGKAINVSNDGCDVELEEGLTMHDVRFHAVIDTIANKITIRPKEGSMVIIGIVDGLDTEAFIEQCSEIDQVEIAIGNKQYLVNKDGHKITAGDDSLKDVLNLVIDAVQNIIVIQGRNPDRVKLMQAKQKTQNIFQ